MVYGTKRLPCCHPNCCQRQPLFGAIRGASPRLSPHAPEADENALRFSTEAVWWAQILKIVLGLAAVLLVKEGTRVPLDALCQGHMIARSIRYCLIVVTAGIVWPLTFRWFGKMGKGETKSAEDLETTKG